MWICQSCYMDLSKFVDQDFKAYWSFCFELKESCWTSQSTQCLGSVVPLAMFFCIRAWYAPQSHRCPFWIAGCCCHGLIIALARSRRILFEPAELLSSRELLSERSDQAEFVMRCGGGGTHWWTKAHIAYVGVVGLLTSNLDDHQLEEGRSGCDKNICICICICICWRDEQNERSTPQSWKKGHKWLAGCDKKSGTLLSPFWWKVPPTTTFHL